MKALEILQDIADSLGEGDQVRTDYSGRCMYGDKCLGLVTDKPLKVVELAAVEGFSGACMDSMGLSSIVYWPKTENKDLT